ncbi:MAG: 4'-phosphopantetheinyl transferase family protein [Flavobacteriales bacterium]
MNLETLYKKFGIQVLSTGLSSLSANDVFLFPEEEIQLKKFQNDKRKKEFLGARKLRNQLAIKSPIKYNASGKPYFADDTNTAISISHTKDLVTICTASFEIGIDVETTQDRIHKVIDKFASEHEKNLYEADQFNLTEWYTFIWCVKEAIYKIGQMKGLSFKDEIYIDKIETTSTDFLQISATLKPNLNREKSITVYCVKDESNLFAIARFKD